MKSLTNYIIEASSADHLRGWASDHKWNKWAKEDKSAIDAFIKSKIPHDMNVNSVNFIFGGTKDVRVYFCGQDENQNKVDRVFFRYGDSHSPKLKEVVHEHPSDGDLFSVWGPSSRKDGDRYTGIEVRSNKHMFLLYNIDKDKIASYDMPSFKHNPKLFDELKENDMYEKFLDVIRLINKNANPKYITSVED